MATISDLLVRIAVDLSGLTTGLAQAEGKIQAFIASTALATARLEQSALAGAAFGASVVGFYAMATKAAGDLQKQQMLLAQAAEASGRSFDLAKLADLAAHYSRLTGFTRAEITAAQFAITTFGATQEQIEQLTPRMLDIAVKTGSLANAATLVGRALTGQDMALRRVLGQLGAGINLTSGFADAMALLDSRMGGLAVQFAQTLPGSISRFKVAVNEFLIAVGGPLIGDVTGLANAGISLLGAATGLMTAFPGVTHVFEVLTVVVGILALSMAGLVGAFKVMPAVLAIMQGGIDLLITPMIGLTAATDAAILSFMGLNTVMQVGVIGAIITALVLLAQNWDKVARATAFAIAWASAYAQGLAKGNFSVRDAAKAANEYADALTGQSVAAQKAAVANKDLDATLASLKGNYELFTKKTATNELLAQITNAQAAIKALQGAQTTADVKAIESGRLRADELAAQVKLQQDIEQMERRILQVRAQPGGEAAAQPLEEELAKMGKQLLDSRLKQEQDVASATVDAKKAEIEEKMHLDAQEAKLASDLTVARVEQQRTLGDEQVRIAEEQEQRRVDLLKVEEELRLAMLQRTAEVERGLMVEQIAVRESLLQAGEEEFTAFQIGQNELRRRMIVAGQLSVTEAQRQSDQEIEAHEVEKVRAQVAAEQAKADAIERTYQIQRTLAEQEAASRQTVLAAETKALQDKLRLDEKMREDDLHLSEVTAHAETVARLAELKAQHDLEILNLQSTLAARRASGVISPEEEAARATAIQDIDKGYGEAAKVLADSLQIKYDTVHEQILASRKNMNAQIALSDQQQAARSTSIAVQLNQTQVMLAQKRAEDVAKAAAEIAGLEAGVAKWIEQESAKLRGEGLSPDAIISRLKPIIDAQATLHGMALGAGAPNAAANFRSITDPFTGTTWMQDLATGAWKTAQAATQAASAAISGAVGAPSPARTAVAPVSGVNVSGSGNSIFSFNGVTITLTADEEAVLHRVIGALLGPEGNRQVEQWIRSQPGGTRVTAGGQ